MEIETLYYMGIEGSYKKYTAFFGPSYAGNGITTAIILFHFAETQPDNSIIYSSYQEAEKQAFIKSFGEEEYNTYFKRED